MSRRVLRIFVSLAIAAAALASVVEAKRSKRSRTLDEFLSLMKWMLLFIFGPVIFFFLYNIILDPSFPSLMREIARRLKARVTAQVGPKRRRRRRDIRVQS